MFRFRKYKNNKIVLANIMFAINHNFEPLLSARLESQVRKECFALYLAKQR